MILFVDINFRNLFREDTFVIWSQNCSQDIFSREPTLARNNGFVLTDKESTNKHMIILRASDWFFDTSDLEQNTAAVAKV